MKTIRKAMFTGGVAAILLAFSVAASAGFSGPVAVNSGTCSNTPLEQTDGDDANGTCVVDAAAPSLTITGTELPEGFAGGSVTKYTYSGPHGGGQVLFHWAYETADDAAEFDPAGFFIAGVMQQLTNNTFSNQSGDFAFEVLENEAFGFYVATTDGRFGAARLTVTNQRVTNDIPEPGSLVLVGLGLIGVAALRRRKQ